MISPQLAETIDLHLESLKLERAVFEFSDNFTRISAVTAVSTILPPFFKRFSALSNILCILPLVPPMIITSRGGSPSIASGALPSIA